MPKGNKYVIKGNNNQAVQGEYNQVTQQNYFKVSNDDKLAQAQIVELLAKLEEKIQQSALPEDIKENTIKRIAASSVEVQEKEPDKKLAAGNLRKVTQIITEVSKTSEEVKKLLENIIPILMPISGWLGETIHHFPGN